MPTTTGIATEFIQFSRTSNATVTDSDGKIKWAPHNFLLASEQFDSASWSKANFTSADPVVSANAGAAPNGATTADRVDFGAIDASGDYSIVSQSFTAPGTALTASFWVKAFAAGDVGKKIGIYLYDTGIVGVAFATLTADWQQLTTSGTLTAGAGRAYVIGALGSAFTGGVNQGAVSVLIWGAALYRSDLSMQPNTSAYPMYNPTTPKNLLGFSESLTTGWTNTNTTDAIVGEVNPNGLTGAVDVAATAGNGTLLSSISLLASPYTFSIWLKRKTGSGTVEITVDGTTYVAAAVTNTWTRVSTTLTPTAGTKTPGIRIVTSGDAVYAWGAQLSDSASLDPYFPSYFTAPTAAAYYGPRRDFDGSTLACKGLLVEEQRTNIVLYSNDFSQAVWTKINGGAGTAPIVTSGQSDPWGGTTAWRLQANAGGTGAGDYSLVRQVIASVTSPRSVWIKSNTGSNQSVVFGGAEVGQVVTATTTWTRVNVTPSSTNPIVDIGSYPVGTGNSTQSVDVLLWGAQCETAGGASVTFTTSYMPTVATTFQRNADIASVSAQAFPYSATEGALVAAYQLLANTGSYKRVFDLYDTTKGVYANIIAVNGINTASAPIYAEIVDGSSTQASFNLGTPAAGTNKSGLAWAANNINAANNGTLGTLDTTGTIPSANNLRIGSHADGTLLNGWIRQITYIPRRISDAELQVRTA